INIPARPREEPTFTGRPRCKLSHVLRLNLANSSVIAGIILCSIGIECPAQTAAPRPNSSNTEWRQVSSFKFDWDSRGTARIIVERPSRWDGPGDFMRIRVR